jgi:hypothetical protein
LTEPTAGDEYAKLIAEQLGEERTTKTSLEQRGITVVTTSGTLVTLLFGLVAIVTKDARFRLDDLGRAGLFGALSLFVLAAVAALSTNFPQKYQEVEPDELSRLVTEQFWNADQGLGSRRASEVRVAVLTSARAANAEKARLVRWAIGLEVAAVASLSYGVIHMLWQTTTS